MILNIRKSMLIDIITFTLPVMIGILLGASFNISLADIFIPIASIIVLFDYKRNKTKNTTKAIPKICIIYILLIIIMLLFSIYKINLFYTIVDVKRAIIYAFKLLINILYFIIYIYMFRTYGEEFELKFLKSWNYAAILVSILAITGVGLSYIGIQTFLVSSFRATSTFNDPNLLGSYIIMSIAISSIYNHKNNKNIVGFNTVIQMMTIILTASRGILIAVIISIVLILLIKVLNLDIYSILKFIFYATVVLIFTGITNYLLQNFLDINIFEKAVGRVDDISINIVGDSRFSKWRNALIIWYNEPILGCGLGMFRTKSILLGLTNGNVLTHNTYLNFLSELGIAGSAIMLWLPITVILRCLKFAYINNFNYICLLFALVGVAICAFSLNLENFRCLWVFVCYSSYCTMLNIQKKDYKANV